MAKRPDVAERNRLLAKHGRSMSGDKTYKTWSASDAAQIRVLRASGLPLKTLALRFGVRESMISRVANGKRRAQ
jgi:hypothetical protein